ncbi:GNAT family N-acetyltransferase [Dehalogenimonas alkenigignens]|uniref:GNAT family N-acetyltransferase n=1 Tax=Dehalogenimonas alkenigignens TaxID=1217799 RepID=UPI000D570EB7|nr:GNAT family N-acetyltransferase [Dehalogenimonas alkenigignens]PVV83309.1 N-acetyltransferase [Dehalogenimonas alkenigignens]
MNIAIRQATAADEPVIVSLIEALAEYEALEPPTDAARARLAAELASPRPRFEAFIAECGGEPAGFALVFETYSSFLAKPKLYLEDIFVLPAFRRHGVGKALFEHLAATARRRGCAVMEWTALDWNSPAHKFYGKMGGRHLKAWQVFRLDLDAS